MSTQLAWNTPHHMRTRGRVGELYNHLAARVIGGCVNGNVHNSSNLRFGDVHNTDIGLVVESKASDNKHHWRLSAPQMGRYTDARPLISYVYALSSYKNQGRRSKKDRRGRNKSEFYSMLARLKGKGEQFKFLARRTDEVYLLDLEFVHELVALNLVTRLDNGFGNEIAQPSYEIQRNQIRPFREPTDPLLRSLGIEPGRWIFRRHDLVHRFDVEAKPPSHVDYQRTSKYPVEISFPLYTALSPELDRKLDPVIRARDCSDLPF